MTPVGERLPGSGATHNRQNKRASTHREKMLETPTQKDRRQQKSRKSIGSNRKPEGGVRIGTRVFQQKPVKNRSSVELSQLAQLPAGSPWLHITVGEHLLELPSL